MKENTKRTKYDLEDRLIDFSVDIIKLSESLPGSAVGKYLSGQITRSGMSSALNYGESQGAESRKDFIHKLGIVLKELRETLVALKIIQRTAIISNSDIISNLMTENIELISIFVRSIKTTKLNQLSHTSKF